jgi:excisionase family DNA binding protein
VIEVVEDNSELLTPGEVARLFGVNPKTITRWATAGKLNPIRTLGGHRRYRAGEVRALLETGGGTDDADEPETSGRA